MGVRVGIEIGDPLFFGAAKNWRTSLTSTFLPYLQAYLITLNRHGQSFPSWR